MSAPPTRRWLRLLAGLLLLLLPLLVMSINGVWQWADLDPAPMFTFSMIGMILLPVCWMLLPIWFFFFSGLTSRTRGIVTGVMLLLAGSAAASIDSFKVDGNLRPIPHFRWQPRSQDLLDQFREAQEDSEGLSAIDLRVDPDTDFPRYRGLNGDGMVVPPAPFAWNWEEKPPRLMWRQPCGGGFAGFAVAGNVAITTEQRRDQEAVVCYDRATGRERWVHAYDAAFRHPTGDGPRATPTIADGEVYSLGATGVLCCLDGVSGKPKWSLNVLEDNQAKCVSWGMTSSPLVAGDLVIVNPGIDPDHNAEQSLAAYRRRDGKRVWAAGAFKAGYSSPLKARLAGREQVLIFDAGGLVARDLATGKKLWRHPWETPQDMNIAQPLVLSGDRVFLSSETTNGCAVLKVTRQGDDFTVEPAWANRNLCAKFANPVALGGAIYGLSNGTMVCIDQQTGRRNWRAKRYGHGQLLAANGAVLVLTERGNLAVVAADTRRFRELASLEVFKARTWSTPALAGRHLFVRNDAEMACFELPLAE
jgi:outer membrane protein assembly factor BamB